MSTASSSESVRKVAPLALHFPLSMDVGEAPYPGELMVGSLIPYREGQ